MLYEVITDKSTLFLRRLEDSGVEDVVRGIIADVAENGDSALFAYAKKFDRAELDALEVTQAELDDALLSIPAELIAAMQTAAENIRAFHSMQLREGFRLERPNGVYMGHRITSYNVCYTKLLRMYSPTFSIGVIFCPM